MNVILERRTRGMIGFTGSFRLLVVTLGLLCFVTAHARAGGSPRPSTVKVSLSEWKVQLTPARVPPGPVTFEVTDVGTIPHSFELEGRGLERSIAQLQPGASATLELELRSGNYEAYCPVGKGSHKMLGMMTHLVVGNAKQSSGKDEAHERGEKYAAGYAASEEADEHEHDAHGHGEAEDDEHEHGGEYDGAKRMTVAGGGPVIQILPGPFPFADSALAVIRNRPADQQADLTHKAHMGPYSNNVARISGDISLVAIDRGAVGDSVSGTAAFTSQDGARWKLVIDRVQTKDIPFNPRFGGVIMGLFYHGASGVHTPLVPTIQSSLALWAYAHLYRNDQLVTDDAMVHVMLLSRTRRPGDWALDCWDCSDRPVEELQLQVTPAPNTPPFEAPGGFLFVNWEKSSGQR
ncbi:MAG TPA: hypothetical protein VI504_01720 [Candidatus Eisenbacteria bacterium]|jgi:hypothetical protein